jgi:hypothetical protein
MQVSGNGFIHFPVHNIELAAKTSAPPLERTGQLSLETALRFCI